MFLRTLLWFYVSYSLLLGSHAYWGEQLMQKLLGRSKKEAVEMKADCKTLPTPPGKKKPNPHETCDENQLMLQLARLYIISPERVVMLFTAESLPDTCKEVTDVLKHMNSTMASCVPLSPDNLYMKLIEGLNYFHQFICQHDERSKIKHINQYHTCLKELREDFVDCEGPADWFEKTNKTIVCPYYSDIVNCNYIKTAMLCGLKPAVLLRSFTSEVMKRVVLHKCKVSRSLPYVEDPMPATGSKLKISFPSSNIIFVCFFFLTLCCIILYPFLNKK